ncbi:MAG: type IX secretion system outer membrane channel protein PorV [Hymenobacteraceae bacterium]|nr:type IX secretion system outer membrane channel protein PorV [Hymenobacteraceae bacterium]
MLIKKYCLRTALLAAFLGVSQLSEAQQSQVGQDEDQLRTITTAGPILTVSPDARSAAMGDAGVAISPDANTPHWNPAKLGFVPNDFSASVSYTPWLRKVINDMSLSYLSAYKKINENSAFSVSLLYFDLGAIEFRQTAQGPGQEFNPKEYTIDAAYGTRLSEYLSLGVGARFIHSNLSGNVAVSGSQTESKPGNSAAVDVGVFYNRDITLGGNEYNLALGGNISNIGAKISYTTADQKDFIPTNLRLGTAITKELDPYNKLTFAFDVNKLLVPSPDTSGLPPTNVGVLSGIFESFSDAPDGFSEEMKEINLSFGLEYWYNELFAARAGYFYENPMKGDRKYLSFGLGVRYQKFGLDVAYLVPNERNNPLAETVRFSLHFDLSKEDDGTLNQ